MTYNYHTHTSLCRHASGAEEEYIIRAIENGIAHMGFSDHIPYKLPDGTEQAFRILVENGDTYIATIKELREKYKGKIDIKIGFEMEYYPSHFEKMLKNAKVYGAEYLILGQHHIELDDKSFLYVMEEIDNEDYLKTYVEYAVRAMEMGIFTYVAHPDLFNFTGNEEVYEEEMRKICIASRELSVPIEINFLGIRDNRNYPKDSFWRMAGEEKSPVTFGFDSHDAESAFDGESLIKAKQMIKKYGLNYAGEPKLIAIP